MSEPSNRFPGEQEATEPGGSGGPPGYQILGKLGQGGMAVVFKAHHLRLNRTVALKIVRPGPHAGQKDLTRFLSATRGVAALQHPNVVPVVEIGEHQGLPYFALEFVPGGSLATRLRETGVSPQQAAEIVQQIANGVHAAHEKGIVHRELKPENILFAEDGTAKVGDFGLARRVDGAGAVVGTPSYMPPEQAGGEAKQPSPTADVYALGAILYECLTGRPPFCGASAKETLSQVMNDEPIPVRTLQPGCPHDLETIVHKCLQKDPGKRYPSAEAMAADLGRFLRNEPILARPAAKGWGVLRWVGRHPAVAALLVLLALTLVAGWAGMNWLSRDAVRQRDIARAEAAKAEQLRDQLAAAEKAGNDARAEMNANAEAERQEAARNELLLADAAWQAGQAALARARLQGVPADARQWEWRYPNRTTDRRLLTLSAHAGRVHALCFSPDGTRLATGGGDNTARIWDVRTGQQLLSIDTAPGPVVYSLCFSPDGSRLVGGTLDRTVKVWDARTGKEVMALRGHTGLAFAVAVSPDGTRIASSSFDPREKKPGEVKVWDAGTGKELLSLADDQGHAEWVSSVCFCPDSTRLATGSLSQGAATVWDARTGKELFTLMGHRGEVWSVAFNPDGTRLATASADRTVKLWDARTGQELLTIEAHKDGVRSASFGSDGTRLATASFDTTAKIWDARTGKELVVLEGHTQPVSSVCFSPDDTRLATTSFDQTAKLWDVRARKEPLAFRGHSGWVFSACLSADGKRLATGSGDRSAKVWNARTGEEIQSFGDHTECVWSVCFSPDGTRLATGSADRTAKVWNLTTGRELLTLKGHTGPVYCVCFNPDGTRLATGSADRTVKVWDARTGRQVLSVDKHAEWVTSVYFSPDGSRLVSQDGGGHTTVWDATTGRRVDEPPPVRRSADDGVLVSMEGNTVRLIRPSDTDDMLVRRAHTQLEPERQAEGGVRPERQQQWLAVVADLEHSLGGRPSSRLLRDRWFQALTRLIQEQPESLATWRRLVLAQACADQTDAVRETCAEMQRRCRLSGALTQAGLPFRTVPHDALSAALTLQLLHHPSFPAGAGLFDRVLTIRASVLYPDALPNSAAWLSALPEGEKILRGAILCRAGRHAEAVEMLKDEPDAMALLFRAIAEHGRGDDKAARAAFEEALKLRTVAKPDWVQTTPNPWTEQVEFHVLRQEVERLLPNR